MVIEDKKKPPMKPLKKFPPFSRGTSFNLPIIIKKQNETPFNITGYELRFTLKHNLYDFDYSDKFSLLSKNAIITDASKGQCEFHFNSKQTWLPPGEYFFDIELIHSTKGVIRLCTFSVDIVGGPSNYNNATEAPEFYSDGISCTFSNGIPITVVVPVAESQGLGYKMDIVNPTGLGSVSINRNPDPDARIGDKSVAMGNTATASGKVSIALGQAARAVGDYSYAEGFNTLAKGMTSHAEGESSSAEGDHAHAEGSGCLAGGNDSHAEGYHTTTNNWGEHSSGKFNFSTRDEDAQEDNGTLFSIGIGTSLMDRKNGFELKRNGDCYIFGIGGYNGTNSIVAKTLKQVIDGKVDNSHLTYEELPFKMPNGSTEYRKVVIWND